MKTHRTPKTTTHLFAALLAFTLMTGCGSEVPIAGIDEAVFDPALVGLWEPLNADPDDTPTELLILSFDDRAYYAEMRELKEDGEVERFRAYVTYVGTTPFINAQYINTFDAEERDFLLFTYRITDEGELVLTPLQGVDDVSIDDFSTPDALRSYIEAHLDDDGLYDESGWFRRVAP